MTQIITMTSSGALTKAMLEPIAFTLGLAVLAGAWWLVGRIGESARRSAAREWEARHALPPVDGDRRVAA
ncbi:MAG TPA: hypothetical protein VMS22_02685 [Candidatus Eisenbacteria bacterium]|nr:hypothetical protein [Candidatus Eisenbacteria bacterium]